LYVIIRNVIESDLPIFFEHQLSREASAMAAFPSRDKAAFDAHWAKIMANESNILKTIEVDGQVTGNMVSWEVEEGREVGYWLGKEFWGRGIATRALMQFLEIVDRRPLVAHVAKHNVGSRRVLEKCGFKVIGEDRYMNRGREDVEEFILKLEGD